MYCKCTHKCTCMWVEETQASLLSSKNVKACSSSVMTSLGILILLILKDISVFGGVCLSPSDRETHRVHILYDGKQC